MTRSDQPQICEESQGTRIVSRGWAWLIALAAALALYRATMAPGLLWGDSGEAQLHTLLSGWYVDGQIARSHVLYYAISRTLAQLVSMEAARAANWVSVLGGAFAVANLAWILATFARHRLTVIVGVLLLMLSHTLWQLSTSAEVVSLSVALLGAELIAFIKLRETGSIRWVFAIALANGFGLSNHNFALLMWPVYAVIAIRFASTWRLRAGSGILAAVAGLLLGAMPVLLLGADHWRTHGDLLQTARSFLVGEYGGRAINAGQLPRLLGTALGATALNFPTPLLFLAPLGLVRTYRFTDRPLAWLILAGGAMHFAFAARYHVPDQHTFLVPTYFILTLLLSLGIGSVFEPSPRRSRPFLHGPFGQFSVIALALIAPIVYAAAPPLLRRIAPNFGPMPARPVAYRDRFDWFLRPWRIGYDGPERLARETLLSLPADAWLVADSTLTPPLNYVQVSQQLRLDVRTDNVLARQDWLPPLDESDRRRKLDQGLLFTTSIEPQYLPCWLQAANLRFEPAGHVFRAVRVE